MNSVRILTVVAALALPSAAWAELTPTIDGDSSDWASVSSCITDVAEGGANTIDLRRFCLENDNSGSGDNGYLYILWEADAVGTPPLSHFYDLFIDSTNNGTFANTDRVVSAKFTTASGSAPDSMGVYNGTGTYPGSPGTKLSTYSSTATCGATAGQDGWSAARTVVGVRHVVEMRIGYGCLAVLAGVGFDYNNDERRLYGGTYPTVNEDVTTQVFYSGTTGAMGVPSTPGNVTAFTATAGNGQNTIYWTNPAVSSHSGVLVLRGTAIPNTAPTNGTTYAVGATIGNATVAYVDAYSSATSFVDTGRTNGTRYYYKIYNHHQRQTYASGAVPSTSGIFSIPTAKTGTNPLWCYSTGLPMLLQPVTERGVAVYTAGQSGLITASRTTTGTPATDGTELWRPVAVTNPVQSRFLLVPLQGQSGNFIITGDQGNTTGPVAPRVTVVSASSGTVLWATALTGEDRVQGQLAVQLYAYANAAFQGAAAVAGADLIFVATRNSSATNNKVYALRSNTGAVAWTYSPGNMDIVNGGLMVDYATNTVWVASLRNGGANQPSLRALDSTTGAELTTFQYGDISNGVTVNTSTNQALTVTDTGVVYGINLATRVQAFTTTLPAAPNAWLYAMANGFIASYGTGASGAVRRYTVSGSTATTMWTRAVTGPTGVAVNFATGKVFVGSSGGGLRQLNVATGAVDSTVTVTSTSPTGLGHPTIDTIANRVHVGTQDGRLCAYPMPLP